MGILDDIGGAVKSVVKSPITKAVAGGVAVVCPAVGAPALAGIAAANTVISAAESADKVRRAAAQRSIKATATLAQTDAGAATAYKAMQTLVEARRGSSLARMFLRQQLNANFKAMAHNPAEAAAAPQVRRVVANHGYLRAKELNKLIIAYNSTNESERSRARAQVSKLRQSKSPRARAQLQTLARRTAALRTARRYVIDARGMVKLRSDVRIGADELSPAPAHPPLPKLCTVVPPGITWWVELEHAPGEACNFRWCAPFRATAAAAMQRARPELELYRWTGRSWNRAA